MEYILSCPFCGCEVVEICRTNPNACWIECASCGAGSKSHKTRKRAIDNWNHRFVAIPAEVVHDGDKEYRERRRKLTGHGGKP